jgi:hypothetical protein
MIISRAWTDDIAHLTGVANERGESRSNRMLDVILDSVAAKPGAAADVLAGAPAAADAGTAAAPAAEL